MLSKTRMSVLGCVLLGGAISIGGCSFGGDHDRGYAYDRDRDYRGGDYAAWRDERNKEIGDRNTIISDKADDGRVNGSARSYEERKADRAAQEGVPGAAREERQLRDERLYGQ